MELTNDDLKYTKNSFGEKKIQKSKMIQTIQNTNKDRFFAKENYGSTPTSKRLEQKKVQTDDNRAVFYPK
jgi:hypothetical protein